MSIFQLSYTDLYSSYLDRTVPLADGQADPVGYLKALQRLTGKGGAWSHAWTQWVDDLPSRGHKRGGGVLYDPAWYGSETVTEFIALCGLYSEMGKWIQDSSTRGSNKRSSAHSSEWGYDRGWSKWQRR